MTTKPHKNAGLNQLLDVFSGRSGTIAVIGLFLGACLGGAIYLQSAMSSIDRNLSLFNTGKLRNGYAALSDISRLVLVAQTAAVTGEMTPTLAEEFEYASDILWVRFDNFEMVVNRGAPTRTGDATLASLQDINSIAERAILNGFAAPTDLAFALLTAAETARSNLVIYMDEVRRQGDLVLDQKALIVRKQHSFILASLIVLTLVGSAALLLLRREVLARQASEKAERRVEFLAHNDVLTRLPNRAQFQVTFDKLLSDPAPVTLLLINLDDFKALNDTCGRAAGDAVLCHVASTLSAQASARNAITARLAGDEFAFAMSGCETKTITEVCQTLLAHTRKALRHDGRSVSIKLSMGVAASNQVPDNITPPSDAMMRAADFALSHAKTSGGDRFTIYDDVLEQKYLERRALMSALPPAIQNGELAVYLQPKVDLPSKDVFGFEALVRWPRDQHIVPPGDFISMAEDSGLVVEIDRFMLNEATKIMQLWNTQQGRACSVSINLSTLHFRSDRIVAWVQQALWASELPPHLLTLEITETLEMSDWSKARGVINNLRDLGCRIAIDDFGSGFSSLAYLLTTQADELKIDKSLIDRIETSKDACLLLSSVLDIARNLGLEVIAEGIETQAQSDVIQTMGVPQAQGYLFGRPLPHREALAAAAYPDDTQNLGMRA